MVEIFRQQHSFKYGDQYFTLLKEKCVLWQNTSTLILSDLHFGKTGHFRKSGIPISSAAAISDLHKLTTLITQHQAGRLIITGDMFHSHANADFIFFGAWKKSLPPLEIILIKGNHDIIDHSMYEQLEVNVYTHSYLESGIYFSHEAKGKGDCFSFSGHIHPAITIAGKAHQHLKLPCFYINQTHCLLPAFGNLTGGVSIKAEKGASIFAIGGDKILSL
ncbi:MAG: ligase-associated DNA damage response endonuclease PdeM [Bacteroidetes bacterium]|nr:ligase-associated DNA damage response endonuclease PdeM [Bacteroidota bacterium]